MDSQVALMVIDVQVGMFHENNPVYNSDVLLRNIKLLIEQARSSKTPIIYIQHSARPGRALEHGTPGWKIHPDILPRFEDEVIQKKTPNSFYETNLQEVLLEKGIKKLILTGIQTELCVDTTCRHARSLGYEVTLASDSHSTWARGELSAQQIIAHHNRLLCWFANVEKSNNILL
ncbi:cysteine hydrolase family protein [Paenibacillus allorhizosphaerae]|uniref:Peroxyureidoacrylate/ureidoacrylate amidohydrolase RutB n=1 Tax=Paenibacillus allorhizosphaerae TaxID=2849866 RepID=A0ABN7TXL4_9BACL|nr:cysteine hydrolase family protein [Paenibacillus allorhizosphaerae]CAG7658821.1 Peroxyureidoacrylate/ureidoacrylate amidohydrolase RutB [Paenibacillus allorhizosphaerae]